MTRRTNARLAGIAYLLYIAAAFPAMLLSSRATSGDGMAAKLAGLALHATDVRLAAVLSLIGCCCALVLAVTLYALTREQDRDLALLALTARVAEGVTGAASIPITLGLLALATAAGTDTPDPRAAGAIGAFVLAQPWLIGATFFAVGSTLFAYLLLRGRIVPVALAWLGVLASVLLVVLLPGQLAGFIKGPVLDFMWLPALVFEVTLALWLLIKGVAMPLNREASKTP